MLSDFKETFNKNIQQIIEKQNKLNIVITQVDPDAMASGFAIKYILSKVYKFTNVEIYICGNISHPQNKTIANYFNLISQMKNIKEIETDKPFGFVDSHDLIDSRLSIELNPENLFFIIDHHRGEVSKLLNKNCSIWIDEVGAASTLITELIQSCEISFEEEASYIYNLLALGIYTDTKSLVSATTRDMAAFSYLRGYLDPLDIARFISYPQPSSYFKNLCQSLSSFHQKESKGIASLGFISKNERDDLSSIADMLLRREGINFVAVWGIIEDTVSISFRSHNLSNPLDSFIKEKFNGLGGAKLGADGRAEGGAAIPISLSFWATNDNKDLLLQIAQSRINSLIFD